MRFERVIIESPIRPMSAATSIEATMVIEARLGRDGADELDLGIHEAAVVLVDIARRARRRWG